MKHTSKIRITFCLLAEKIILHWKGYWLLFDKNIRTSTLMIDKKNLKITLYIKGTREPLLYTLHEIIYDLAVLSTLKPKDAANIGFFYGLKYSSLDSLSNSRLNFSLNHYQTNCNLISIDRKKNINFTFTQGIHIKHYTMKPEEILKKNTILSHFHSVQACYIGMLAGLSASKS